MAKKQRRQNNSIEDEALHYPAVPPPASVPELPARTYLEGIRSNFLNVRTDIARTIGELEAHREEIEATIAFLRARRQP